MAETGFLDLCDLARAAAARGDLDTARARFEEATSLRPDSIDVRYGLATICFMLGDAGSAREHFDMVQRYDPTHAGAAINLGAIANMNGDYDEAVRQLRKGISLDPKRGEAYYNLGIAYRKLGRNELAIQAYREAHHHNPRMVEAVYNLANTYYEMERYEQAAMFYRKALDINPNFRKAQEGLLRVERQMRPKTASAYDDDDEDRSWTDPFMGDNRLDRPLSPDHDFDSLARAHSATTEAKRDTDEWIKSTSQLHDAVRELAIAISTNSEIYETSVRVRDHLRRFRALRAKLDEKREAVVRVRDSMVERG